MPESIDGPFLNKISDYIDSARAKVADGITIAELAELTITSMRLAIEALDRIEMPGSDKKAEVLKLVAYFFDQFADACVPMLARPFWWLVKPAVRALVLSLASGAVESILQVVRKIG